MTIAAIVLAFLSLKTGPSSKVSFVFINVVCLTVLYIHSIVLKNCLSISNFLNKFLSEINTSSWQEILFPVLSF